MLGRRFMENWDNILGHSCLSTVTTRVTYCVGKETRAVSLKVLILLSTNYANCPLYCDLWVFLEHGVLSRLQGLPHFSEKALQSVLSKLPLPHQQLNASIDGCMA